MKRNKARPIGIVVADEVIRATQEVDGEPVFATVPIEDNLKKAIRLLRSSAPFVGDEVALGIEGSAVLIESITIPSGAGKSPMAIGAERLKGDPLFDADKAVLHVAARPAPGSDGHGDQLAILAAIRRERLDEVMKACRESDLAVCSVEAAPLALWRSIGGNGLEAFLVRFGGRDTLLAGIDGALLFARIVAGTASGVELKTTLSRAAVLLGAERTPVLKAVGLEDLDVANLAAELDSSVETLERDLADPAALGLASEGVVLCDFLPPEEKSLRERRRLRRMRMTVATAVSVVLAMSGVLGWQGLAHLDEEYASLQEERAMQEQERGVLDETLAEIARHEANEQLISAVRPGHRMATLFELLANSSSDEIFVETLHVQDVTDPSRLDENGQSEHRVLECRVSGLASNGLAVRELADVLLGSGAFGDVRVQASERVLLGMGLEGERFRLLATAETH